MSASSIEDASGEYSIDYTSMKGSADLTSALARGVSCGDGDTAGVEQLDRSMIGQTAG